MSNEEFFGLICFLVLTQRDGVNEMHPDYLKEKISFLLDGYAAYSRLSRSYQHDVITYHQRWKLDLPDYVVKWESDYNKNLVEIISQK